jgi:hypothetical protein
MSIGAEQVRASSVPGILAINVQEFVGAGVHYSATRTDRSRGVELALERVHGHFDEVLEEDRVVGALLCGMTYAWIDEGRVSTFSNQLFHQLVLRSSDPSERLSFVTSWQFHLRTLQTWINRNL